MSNKVGPAAGQAHPGQNRRRRQSSRRTRASQDRPPPQDHHAEQATLGSICLAGVAEQGREVLATIRRIVAAVDAFYAPEHRAVYAAADALDNAGTPIDIVTIKDELTRRGELESVGGDAGLLALVESVPSWANYEHYARIVARNHRHREAIRFADRVRDAAYDCDDHALRDALDSIRAPLESGSARNEFSVVTASELDGGDEGYSWVLEGYIARGAVTELTALWKAGKSTAIGWLLRAMEHGGDLAGTVTPGRALVVTEESRRTWAIRCAAIGIGDHVSFICRPFKCRPSADQWAALIGQIAGMVRRDDLALVAFDTIAPLWPCDDENDAAKVLAAVTPLHEIAEAGAAVLISHHPRKGGGSEGQAGRGSGALPGFVDCIVELHRFDRESHDDRRRVLRAFSRFDATPAEVVIELRDDGYALVGTKSDAGRADRMDIIADILPAEGHGLTIDEVRAAWPEGSVVKPGKRTLASDLHDGAQAGRWIERGDGVKGSPFRYSIPADTDSKAARNESNDEQPPGDAPICESDLRAFSD